MKRWQTILSSCLIALLMLTSVVWAATKYKTQTKIDGTKLTVQHYVVGSGKIKNSAVLFDKKNKIVARWNPVTSNKWYKIYENGYKDIRFLHYVIDTGTLAAGKYRFVATTTFDNKRTVKDTHVINYKPKLTMKYNRTKVVRNSNGDILQRLYFKKSGSKGKTCYAQIFDKRNKLVHSVKYKAQNGNQDFAFSWNGWGRGTSAKKCPKGIYTVKYWMDGVNPKTAKFRLSI
ncbi:MAG: hypothetical protein Q4E64_08525 [Phascolarctobacterium sp.]|uniref:hypothetical protein n=1 Tax=Phascolarctobacterium sp. TaxID=2049039 RepID=UPI0026DBA021|nr:hypothetical protein [Phascolarctobacterium sp.]MDO4921850.1 hypothetical protein [Phascolarctobacterium sp.]